MSTDSEAQTLRSQCVDLLFDCPRNSSVPACPFSKVRELDDVVQRVNWLKGLPLEELKRLTKHHKQCFSRHRAASLRPPQLVGPDNEW